MKSWIFDLLLAALVALVALINQSVTLAVRTLWTWTLDQFRVVAVIPLGTELYQTTLDWAGSLPHNCHARRFFVSPQGTAATGSAAPTSQGQIAPVETDDDGGAGWGAGADDPKGDYHVGATRGYSFDTLTSRILARGKMARAVRGPGGINTGTTATAGEQSNIGTSLTPSGLTRHVFRHKGIWVRVEERYNTNPSIKDAVICTLEVSCWSRSQKALWALLDDIRAFGEVRKVKALTVFISEGVNWWAEPLRYVRPANSVVLDNNLMQGLLTDVGEFFDSAAYYRDMGIPHHRGYTLLGPPGTGKTSTIQAVAGNLGLTIYVLRLNDPGLNDRSLTSLKRGILPGSAVVMEDFDTVEFIDPDRLAQGQMPMRQAAASEQYAALADKSGVGPKLRERSRLTQPALLNFLDGLGSPEGLIYFFTANDEKRILPAFRRPGRMDVVIHFDYATQRQMREMFERFYPHEPAGKAQEFADLIVDPITTAEIQQIMLLHRDDADGVLEAAAQWKPAEPRERSGTSDA